MKEAKAKLWKAGQRLCTSQRPLLVLTQECLDKTIALGNPKAMYVMDDNEMVLLSVKDLFPQLVPPPQYIVNTQRQMEANKDLKEEGIM